MKSRCQPVRSSGKVRELVGAGRGRVKRFIATLFLGVLVVCDLQAQVSDQKPSTELFSTSWESGIDPRLNREAISSGNFKISPLNNSQITTALAVTIWHEDDYTDVANGVPRAELSFVNIFRFVRGGEYILTWQTFLPPDYKLDGLQPEVISQIHPGVRYGGPTFSLFIVGSGRYGVRVRSGVGRPTEGVQFGDVERDRGRVVNWRLHYIPDDIGTHSFLELQKDGVSILKVSGVPTAYPNDDNAYFKIGLYKSAWQMKPSDVAVRTVSYGRVVIEKTN
jgi:hypothetical protein